MTITNNIKRGEIYYADLSSGCGSEQCGSRPVLILQNNIGNMYSPTTLIAPLTTRSKKNELPTHVLLKSDSNNLSYDSTVLLEQISVIDKKRLRERITYLDTSQMREINNAIAISLGLGNSKKAEVSNYNYATN